LRGGFCIGAVVVVHRDAMRAVAVVAVGMRLHLLGATLVVVVVVGVAAVLVILSCVVLCSKKHKPAC
jgi:hypothetical protein